MKYRQLAQVGLGLLGIWALLTASAIFIQIIGIAGHALAPLALEVIPVGIMLGVSYLLIFHNAKVAAAIFPDIEAAAVHAPTDLARTLIALTGVFLLVEATPGVVNTILTFLFAGEIDDPRVRGQLIRRFIGSLVPIAAGIYLIARPGRLLEYLQRPLPEQTAAAE